MSTESVRRPTLLAGLAALAAVAFAANDARVTYGLLPLLAVGGGGVLAVSTGLASRDEPLAVFAASVLVPVGGVAVLAATALSVVDLPLLEGILDPFVLLGLAVAGFGSVAAFTGGVGGGAVGRAFSVVVATTALPFAAGVAAVLARLHAQTRLFGQFGRYAGVIVDLVIAPSGSVVDVVVFVFLLAVTARALAAGLSAAPLVELASRDRRASVAKLAQSAVVVCLSVWRLAAVGWVAAFVAVVTGAGAGLVQSLPPVVVSSFGTTASSGPLRIAMIAAVALSLLLVAGLKLARLVTGDHREGLRRLAPTAGGGVLAAATGMVFASDVVGVARNATPEQLRPVVDAAVGLFGEPALALGALVVPLVGVAGLLLFFAGLGWIRAVPQHAAPAAVAAAGLVLAGTFAGIQNASPGFVFALVAAGMVAWDVGEYGVGLVGELGRGMPTARVELVHVGAAVALGVGSYYAAFTLYDLTGGLGASSSTTALAALVTAGVGLAAIVAALAD